MLVTIAVLSRMFFFSSKERTRQRVLDDDESDIVALLSGQGRIRSSRAEEG
jgi:hypothetical protein